MRRRTGRTRSRRPVTIVESLTPEALVAKAIPPPPGHARRASASRSDRARAGATAAEAGPLRRFYFALPFSPRGRPGPPSAIAELRLTALPEAPSR